MQKKKNLYSTTVQVLKENKHFPKKTKLNSTEDKIKSLPHFQK